MEVSIGQVVEDEGEVSGGENQVGRD